MTIDEAIVLLRKSASKSLDYEWQREQYQIAEWLEELKAYKENSNGYNKEDIELNRNAMYNKAIDDFAEKLSLAFDETIEEYGFYPENLIRQVAEQLRQVAQNE